MDEKIEYSSSHHGAANIFRTHKHDERQVALVAPFDWIVLIDCRRVSLV